MKIRKATAAVGRSIWNFIKRQGIGEVAVFVTFLIYFVYSWVYAPGIVTFMMGIMLFGYFGKWILFDLQKQISDSYKSECKNLWSYITKSLDTPSSDV